MFSRFINLFFIAFWNKEEDVKALQILSKILFQRQSTRDDVVNLAIFKLNLGSLKLHILFFVK